MPCAREIPEAGSIVAVFDAGSDSGADAGVELARMSTEDGTLRIVRRSERTHTIHYAVWKDGETQLDGLVDASPEFRIADLDRDGTIDAIVADTKEKSTARFRAYGVSDAVNGTPDDMAWYWIGSAANVDAAVTALANVPRIDFSVPEVCGAIDRAPRAGVEAWLVNESCGAIDRAPRAGVEAWLVNDTGWTRMTKKRGPEWSCGMAMQDGPGYWMPELRCSKLVPACEALLLSGGHGGTALPHETYLFFMRTSGRLELQAVAINDH